MEFPLQKGCIPNEAHVFHLPVVSVVGGDGDIADGCIEPHIEDFAVIPLKWHWGTPDQIPGDAAEIETIPHPSFCQLQKKNCRVSRLSLR